MRKMAWCGNLDVQKCITLWDTSREIAERIEGSGTPEIPSTRQETGQKVLTRTISCCGEYVSLSNNSICRCCRLPLDWRRDSIFQHKELEDVSCRQFVYIKWKLSHASTSTGQVIASEVGLPAHKFFAIHALLKINIPAWLRVNIVQLGDVIKLWK